MEFLTIKNDPSILQIIRLLPVDRRRDVTQSLRSTGIIIALFAIPENASGTSVIKKEKEEPIGEVE